MSAPPKMPEPAVPTPPKKPATPAVVDAEGFLLPDYRGKMAWQLKGSVYEDTVPEGGKKS